MKVAISHARKKNPFPKSSHPAPGLHLFNDPIVISRVNFHSNHKRVQSITRIQHIPRQFVAKFLSEVWIWKEIMSLLDAEK